MADLSSVKVEDIVMWTSGKSIALLIVSKITKFHIVTKDGKKFKIKGGHLVGSSAWDTSYIDSYDESIWNAYKERMRLENMRRIISRVEWWSVDNSLIEQVYTLVKK